MTEQPQRRRSRPFLRAAGWLPAAWLSVAAAQTAPALPAPPAASASAAAPSPAAPRPPVARLPIERFAALPLLSDVTLSPDGQRIAAVVNQEDKSVLVTRRVDADKHDAVLQTDNQKFHFRWAHWVSDERLLVSIEFASQRGRVGSLETRLFSVKPDGSGLVNLVRSAPEAGSKLPPTGTQQLQDSVVDWLPEDGQHVLLQLGDADGAPPAVYRVNVETGERRLVQASSRDVYQWLTDAQHRVRVAVRQDREGLFEIRACDPDGKNWRTLWSFTAQGDTVWPMGFGLDPQELYVKAPHEGRTAVFSVRLDDPALPRRLRLSDPAFDVGGSLLRSPDTGEVVGLRGGARSGGRESRSELWDAGWRSLALGLDRLLPDDHVLLMDMSRDEKTYLAYASGNGRPGRYLLGDRRSGELSVLGEDYAALRPADLAGKHRVKIQARDGLALSTYLTLPVGRRLNDGGAALPLVLLPHGGPGHRDTDDFDTGTELLANRGYAVLQVNFRGSDGQGRAFKVAGFQRWGLEMQDDLSDAVQWAITAGVAQASRVCIVGRSYGGYAALMGVVKTPALYRCAVSVGGVTDLVELVLERRYYVGGQAAAELTIGDAWRDRERLRATSPALQAERINAPVLLVHGTDDWAVPVEHSRDMADALKRAGKRYRYIEQEGGDAPMSRYAHRLAFFQALETFLEENLRPTATPDAAARPPG